MKNLKFIALPIVLIMTILFSSGCNKTEPPQNEEPVCNHEYGEWVYEGNAYCNKRVYTQVCSKCGDTQTKQGSDNDHDWQLIKTVTVTCGEDGYSERTCQICDKTEKFDVVEKTGDHGWGDPIIISEPTCGESGFSLIMCYKCQGNELTISPPTGNHTFNSEGVCTTCGHSSEE